jgi:hypothetical protein
LADQGYFWLHRVSLVVKTLAVTYPDLQWIVLDQASGGSTESTMLDMMGHVSAAMLRRYSHNRAKAAVRRSLRRETASPRGVLQEIPKVNDSENQKHSVIH